MQIPWLMLIIGLELVAVLMVLCLLLLLYARKLRRLLARQQEQLRQAITQPAQTADIPEQNQASPPLTAHLQQQLSQTQAFFQSQAPEADINSPDQDTLSPAARAAALHHAILQIELDSGGKRIEDAQWAQIGEHLERLTGTADGEADAPELAQALENAQKRIQNLEKFKKLFFNMEQMWDKARKEAQEYHDQLLEMGQGALEPEQFANLLAKYNSVYDDINHSINAASDRADEPTTTTITLTKPDPRTSDQLAALRNVAADQHRLINKLQKQLQDAESAEQKNAVINQLQSQLDKQDRYLKESEICIKLLESELDTAINKLNEYEVKASAGEAAQEEMDEMRDTLHQYALEAKDLVTRIDLLENENQQLKAADHPQSDTPELASELSSLQKRYIELETQYAELEEKYLILRSQE